MKQVWYQIHIFNGDSSWFGGVRSTSVNLSRQIIACGSDEYIEGYRRKDGTEVKGYWRDK